MDRTTYRRELSALRTSFDAVPSSTMGMSLKVLHLALLSLHYEAIENDRELSEHPYLLTERLIRRTREAFDLAVKLTEIEAPPGGSAPGHREFAPSSHETHAILTELYDRLWSFPAGPQLDRFVERFKHRIAINGIADLIRGKRCLDVGCGNGAFSFAVAEMGADSVVGIDIAPDAIRNVQGVDAQRQSSKGVCEFRVRTAYDTGFPDSHFDFVIQNGVFHHLDHPQGAIDEMARVLKPGGHFWCYLHGDEGIVYDIRDCAVDLLRDVPGALIAKVLGDLNVAQHRLVPIADNLKVRYHRKPWAEVKGMLEKAGFEVLRHLAGGFPENWDRATIEADRYGREKFGGGEFRLLCRLGPKMASR